MLSGTHAVNVKDIGARVVFREHSAWRNSRLKILLWTVTCKCLTGILPVEQQQMLLTTSHTCHQYEYLP